MNKITEKISTKPYINFEKKLSFSYQNRKHYNIMKFS